MSKLKKRSLAIGIWICLILGTACWIAAFMAHGWVYVSLLIGEFICAAWGIYFARDYGKRL